MSDFSVKIVEFPVQCDLHFDFGTLKSDLQKKNSFVDTGARSLQVQKKALVLTGYTPKDMCSNQ